MMADKAESLDEFLLDEHGRLDKKVILAKVPLMVRGLVAGQIDDINNIDVNKDGQADVGQLIKLLVRINPFVAALAQFIKVDKMIEWFVAHDFIDKKDQPKAKEALLEALKEIQKTKASLESGAK